MVGSCDLWPVVGRVNTSIEVAQWWSSVLHSTGELPVVEQQKSSVGKKVC